MSLKEFFKPVCLALAIAVGLCVQSGAARAADTDTLVVAGGCFWCVEADFESLPGVKEAVSGFTGGTVPDPTYKQVVKGGTGHVEAVKITFDPTRVSRADLLDAFFRSVDPTDAGGQFCDRGHSYTTAIFVSGKGEMSVATAAKSRAEQELGSKIVTPILPIAPFYEAGEYHQDFYKSNKIILTRFGPKSRASAYKAYREACGRDARVRQLWGADAPFVGG